MRRWKWVPLALLALVSVRAAGQVTDPVLEAERRLGPPRAVPLEGAALEGEAQAIGALMRCPVCQGLSVADSPTLTAQAMMSEIRTLLGRGYTREQVLEYFEQSYGEFIRLAPRARGFNLVVWIAPVVALVLGVLLVARRLRRAPVAAVASVADPELEAYRERVRREVGGAG